MATNDAVSGIKPPANLQIDSDKSTSWKKWLQQFEWYATAIRLDKKPADVQAATFMAVIGSDAIEIYNSFNLSNVDQNNLQIIKERFREYFAPKTNISFERYIFFKIEQNEDERFNKFLTRIKTQASKCEFDQLFDEILKDKIVFGIRSSQVREKLLTENRLDLNKAITICKTSEQASKQLEEFEGKNRADKVLIVRNKNVKQEQNKYFNCRRCGTNHKSRECPAFNKPCTKCNKNGHFTKMCRTKKNNANKQKNRLNEIEESSNSDDEVYISTLITGEKKNWTENVQVGSVKFTLKLDIGAECNVLPRHLMYKAKGRLKPSRTKHLISYTDDRMAVLGETDLQFKLKNEKQNITFKVVEERVMPILGLNTCEKLGLIARVKTLKEGTDDIFEGLGCYKDYEYDIDLIENPKLEIKASRKIPHAIRHEDKQGLDRMVKLDVIKPETAPTPAVSPMVIVKQKDFEPLKNQSSYEIIEQLKKWFSTHGVPEELQSHNGIQYMSREFRIFQKEWKFNHVTSSPHHHQGNGLAEKAVQTAKNILRKCSIDKSDVQLALLNWRNTPRNENLGSPNQRLFSRVTRSPIPTTENNLKPKLIKGLPTELQRLRDTQVKYSNKRTTRPVNLEINDKVRHKVAHRQWEGARVVEKPEDLPRSVIIQTDKGQTLRRNFSHLHRTQSATKL
ncbi:Endogenous retrovirus group K member 8 Pol protein [Eumeta japonica]|uniref:Endogenous retrovirus group K member 8 Pol protein n=1 Tax=Eumeta variegata TaxID=151549 RepID=A0A4C1XGX4_EUMVA|nr:Endogenous retrovirus group K member 8 Pol protein [Eumeta japonica]